MLELLMTGKVDKYPDSGPGPKNLKFGDTDAGYFGVVSQSELFTAAEIISAITLSVIQRADANMVWCKFYWKNKVVYFPSQFLFNDNTWNAFATKNIVYSNAATRTISKTFSGVQRKFKIRMPAGSTVDPALLTVSPSAEFFALYAKVFARSVINAGWATGVWDSLMEPVARINQYIPTQTTFSTDTNQALWVAYTGSLVNALKSTDPGQGDRGFMPVLELVGLPQATGPGPDKLINSFTNPDNSTQVNGYYGRVSPSELVTARSLETLLGFTNGTANAEPANWLKFLVDGKILFIPQTPLRNGTTFTSLYQAGLVYGTNDTGAVPIGAGVNQYRTVTIDGYVYIVRLLKGTTKPSIQVRTDLNQMTMYTYPDTTYSEFSRTLYNVNVDTPTQALKTGGVWDTFTSANLGFVNDNMNWCQEQETSAANQRLARGGGAGAIGMGSSQTASSTYYSWRPVLELVGPA